MFLSANRIGFGMGNKLVQESGKDVDFTALMTEPLHIEVQYLSMSDVSRRATALLCSYRMQYPIDFREELWRVKLKICDKTPKFTKSDITFVALECSDCLELGGSRECTIHEAALEAFAGRDLRGQATPYANSHVDQSIRSLVDGVLWFDLVPGYVLLPQHRGICMNPNKHYLGRASVQEFVRLWRAPGLGVTDFQ